MCVDELVFRIESRPTPILRHEIAVGKLRLRILVQRLHVRVRRRAIEVVVALLHVLAVVPLMSREPEQSLLEDRISAVPEREGEAESALAVGDSEKPVFSPSVRATAGHVMGEALPNLARGRVILAHRTPLPLGEVRSPALPIQLASGVFFETERFGGRHGSYRYLIAAVLGRELVGSARSVMR
jgi:hypothetical protein